MGWLDSLFYGGKVGGWLGLLARLLVPPAPSPLLDAQRTALSPTPPLYPTFSRRGKRKGPLQIGEGLLGWPEPQTQARARQPMIWPSASRTASSVTSQKSFHQERRAQTEKSAQVPFRLFHSTFSDIKHCIPSQYGSRSNSFAPRVVQRSSPAIQHDVIVTGLFQSRGSFS